MVYPRKKIVLALALAQSALTVPIAHAQLEEVIVTAERREASLQETDIALTAFGETTLKEMGISNFLDVSGFSPNVIMHDMPGKAGAAISIRGFKNAETIATFEPKVAIYQDGVIIAKNAGSLMDVLDLERVEVLRGPQGTLYGRNTVGGAVNLITKKPNVNEFAGSVTATLGQYGQQDIKGNVNVPLIEGKLALKVSAASMTHDGYWKNRVNGERLADKDREAAILQLQWEPADNVTVLYAYDFSEVDDGMMPIQITDVTQARRDAALAGTGIDLFDVVDDGSSKYRSLDMTDEFMKADVDGHSLTVNWDVSEALSIVSISSLRNVEVSNAADSEGSPVFILHNFSGDEIETWTQEFRFIGNAMDQQLNYVAGAFYMDEDIKETYSLPQIGIGVPWNMAKDSGLYFLSGNRASAVNKNWALFGEATYSFTDRLDLTVGLRYTEEERTLNRVDEVGVVAMGTTFIELPEASGTFDDVSGMVSLSYDWSDDAMTYFKVSKGYASGGFNARADNQAPEDFTAGYDEEIVITYELGWKTQWLDKRLQVNGALFSNDYQDIQVNQLSPSGKNNLANAGDATINGLELEIVASITENFETGLNYGYLDSEYDDYFVGPAGTPNDPSDDLNLGNSHFAHAPENTVSAYARYVVPNYKDLGDLIFRLDYQYVDDHWLLTKDDDLGPSSLPLLDRNDAKAYDTVNARLTLSSIQGPGGSMMSVSLWGKNLTDESWYTSGFDLTDGSLGYVGKAVSVPRRYGVDFTVEF